MIQKLSTALLFGVIFLSLTVAALAQDSLNMSCLTRYHSEWGVVNGLAVDSNYAYLATDAGLHILNISNPAAIFETGSCQLTSQLRSIKIRNGYAFVTSPYCGLYVYDVRNPAAPQRISTLIDSSSAGYGPSLSIALQGNYLFVTGENNGGLRIFNISNPIYCTFLSVYNSTATGGHVAVSGNTAYVDFGMFFTAIDISNLAAPRTLGVHIFEYYNVYNFVVKNGYAYIAGYGVYPYSNSGSLTVLDVSNPASIDSVGSLSGTFFGDLDVVDSCLYGIGVNYDDSSDKRSNSAQLSRNRIDETYTQWQLVTVDVSVPAHPQRMSSLSLGGSGLTDFRVCTFGNHVYVGGSWYSFSVYDRTQPSYPRLLSTYDQSGGYEEAAVFGNYAYRVSAGSVNVLDIHNPRAPIDTANINLPFNEQNFLSGVQQTMIDDGILYISCYGQGIYALSLTNPAHPRLISTMSLPALDNYVVHDHILYLVENTGYAYNYGFAIIDIHNPDAPVLLYQNDSLAGRLSLDGNRLYLLNWSAANAITTLDVTNPSRPVRIGTFNAPEWSIAIANRFMYAYGDTGFSVWDISNIASIQRVYLDTTLKPAINAGWVFLQGEHIYLYANTDELTMLSISNPTQPRVVGYYRDPYYPWTRNIAEGNNVVCEMNYLSMGIYDISNALSAPEPRTTPKPATFALMQNYPNPFNASTTISFSLPHPGNAKLEVYNDNGQLVKTLLSEYLAAGEHRLTWNAQALPSGVYFARYQTGNQQRTVKMLLLK